ncbi:hypothetical protein PENSPDRAFT_185840 [Peniophora sp. CONT]|nr:hypothetical protein PENSPDRAFT_185840 [Peniophora sp. CONT]
MFAYEPSHNGYTLSSEGIERPQKGGTIAMVVVSAVHAQVAWCTSVCLYVSAHCVLSQSGRRMILPR